MAYVRDVRKVAVWFSSRMLEQQTGHKHKGTACSVAVGPALCSESVFVQLYRSPPSLRLHASGRPSFLGPILKHAMMASTSASASAYDSALKYAYAVKNHLCNGDRAVPWTGLWKLLLVFELVKTSQDKLAEECSALLKQQEALSAPQKADVDLIVESHAQTRAYHFVLALAWRRHVGGIFQPLDIMINVYALSLGYLAAFTRLSCRHSGSTPSPRALLFHTRQAP